MKPLLGLICPLLSLAAGGLHESFIAPPKAYSIAPYWFWNGKITREATRRQIKAMIEQGGTAVYERSIDLPAVKAGEKLMLDLGEVGLAAEVWLNGKKAGERVWRPFRFDITRQARPGANRLRIRVANSDAGWQSQGDTIYPRGSWGPSTGPNWTGCPRCGPTAWKGRCGC